MTRIAGEVTIDAPVDEVFDMVADERNEPRYNPRILRAEKVSEGPVGAGARFVAEPKGMGSRGEMTLTILGTTGRTGCTTSCGRPTCRSTER
jgi:uncharacterized protein YndB with AHSA1/START domain